MFVLTIKDKYGNVDYLGAFAEERTGTVIGWGSDDSEPDGIRIWTVECCIRVS